MRKLQKSFKENFKSLEKPIPDFQSNNISRKFKDVGVTINELSIWYEKQDFVEITLFLSLAI